MLNDASLAPIPYGAPPQSITTSAQIGATIDLLGQGAGTPPANIIGTAALFGEDPGSGLLKPFFRVITGVAFSGGTSVNLQLRYAADTGAGGGYQPSTWNVIVESGAVATANLLANTILPKLEFEPVFPYNLRPRFMSLYATVVGTFTAGTIAFAGVLLGADEFAQKLAPKNFTV
jgi:hypothetical protein